MNEPADFFSIAIMVLGVISIFGSLILGARKKVVASALSRSTLLLAGLALVQVGMIADRQEERGDLVQVGLLALLLVLLAAAAFVDGSRGRPAEPTACAPTWRPSHT